MIHITKSKGRYRIANAAPNHEELSSSQASGHATRKGIIKNIRSHMKLFESKAGGVLVQDDSIEKSVVLRVTQDRVIRTAIAPGRPFKPFTASSRRTA